MPASTPSHTLVSALLFSSSEKRSSVIEELRQILSLKTNQFFSRREIECLFYLIKGKSARATGIVLHLSQRTVEFYLNSLKEKLHCSKKTDIVDKVCDLLEG